MNRIIIFTLILIVFIQCKNESVNSQINEKDTEIKNVAKPDTEEHIKENNNIDYAIELKKIIQNITNPENKGKFQRLKAILDTINKKKLKEQIIKDTSLIELAIYYELDSVVSKLKEFGFVEHNNNFSNVSQNVSVSNFNKIKGCLKFTKSGKVEKNRFYKFSNKNNQEIPNYNIWEKCYYSSNSKLHQYKGKYFTMLKSCEFKFPSNIITIWEKKDTLLKLDKILDEEIIMPMGGAEIDTIIEINGKNILICKIMGGDGGYYDGTLLFAKYSKPRNIKFLYWVNWNGEIENQRDLTYSLNKNIVDIKISNTKFKEGKTKLMKIDSVLEKEIILNLDTIIGNNRNEIFKKRYY